MVIVHITHRLGSLYAVYDLVSWSQKIAVELESAGCDSVERVLENTIEGHLIDLIIAVFRILHRTD